MKKLTLIITVLLFYSFLYSQNEAEETNTEQDLFELDLEDLMNMEVSIASKKSENIYDAPLSTSVITKQEIINSGATSIPEIFRLIPGFIVREQTNGNYDIHIIGYDYSTPRNSLPYTTNATSLVMIDNRVVFRDFQGGTYWESLPIDITDIERIEVVKGPASALYGPNAVTGVINIITKRASKEGVSADITGQYGNYGTLITNGTAGFKKDKFSVSVSGNMQKRDRFQNTYYDLFAEEYKEHPDSIQHIQFGTPNAFKMTGNDRYPNLNNAADKFGVNGYLNYKIDDENFVDMSFGMQESEVQKIYVDVMHTPFTTERSETQYGNLKANLYGFSIQTSYLNGYSNTLGVLGWEYDYTNLDAQVEYAIKLNDNMQITPGVSYRDVMFDDGIGVENSPLGLGLINGKYKLTTTAFTLRNDFTFAEKFRIIAALRADKYNYPEKMYFSYNIAATYKPNDKSLIRFTASRANKGANMLDTYVDFNFMNFMVYSGNRNLNLMTMDLFELGYRYKISDNLHTDFQINYSSAKDYALATINDSTVVNPQSPYGITNYFSANNISVKPNQISSTVSINYVPVTNLQIKPFITYQKAELVDYDFYSGESGKDSIVTVSNEWTPSVFGGIYINYSPIKKLNINLNTYFFSKGTFYFLYDKTWQIENQIILNARVSYDIHKNISVFANVRNLSLAKNTVQFAFADNIKPLVLGGLIINF